MLSFYVGSGSGEIQLLQPSMVASDWAKLKAVAVKLLNQRGHWPAAEFLEKNPFEIYEGTNSFGDEFELLYMKAPMDRYLELADLHVDPQGKFLGRLVANAMTEVTRSIRFVAVELDTAQGPAPVTSPVLGVTSDVVERALSDAERLLASQGATSGVDRIHTAFHGVPAGAARCAGSRLPAIRRRHRFVQAPSELPRSVQWAGTAPTGGRQDLALTSERGGYLEPCSQSRQRRPRQQCPAPACRSDADDQRGTHIAPLHRREDALKQFGSGANRVAPRCEILAGGASARRPV